MKSETRYDTFTRTRSTWLTLISAGLLWLGACVWVFSIVEFGAIADTLDDTRLALEAEEQVRLDAQVEAAERSRKAAEAESKLVAQARAAEEAKLAAKLKAADAAKLAADARAVEQERVKEAAKLAAEAAEQREWAKESAILAAQARAADAAKLAEEARAKEQERVREVANARQLAALTSQVTGVDEAARKAAAAEASRIAALARQQRNYISTRDRELGVLRGLSSRLRFAPGSATVSRQTERVLDDIFDPLYLYSEAPILVSVATNEYDGTTNDGLLSRDRGRAIASYLINRGLEKERFRIHIESGEELSAGTHHVRVSSEEVRK